MIRPSGEKHTFTQTERIGPFLDGSVKVIEGRGYEETGTPSGFNALGIISHRPNLKTYTLPIRRGLRRYARAVDVESIVQETLMRMWILARDRERELTGENASLQLITRKMEKAVDPAGRSGTVRAVLARITGGA